MRSKISILVLLLMGFILSSCDKSNFEYGDKYAESNKALQTFKNATDNSYTYKTIGASWVGLTWETKITVTNGVVTSREFKYISYAGFEGNIPESDLEWIETGVDIGSRESTPAADAITLDGVYQKAKNDWLQKRKDSKNFFETDNNGIISLCGYRENGCYDDCFIGIRIISVEGI